MTHLALQSIGLAFAGLLMFVVVFALTCRQSLSLRYGLGWMAVAVLLVVLALALLASGGIPASLPISPTGVIAGIGLAFVLSVTLQLSVSLSGHQEAIRQLTEANALLEERLARMERQDNHVTPKETNRLGPPPHAAAATTPGS